MQLETEIKKSQDSTAKDNTSQTEASSLSHVTDLRSQLNVHLLDWVSKQPHGTHSAEYIKIRELKKTEPTHPSLQQNCRLPDYPAYLEKSIPGYNANICQGYIVCEGPDFEHPEKSVPHFLSNICMNYSHTTVDTLIVSGMPDDLFSPPYLHIQNYANYIPAQHNSRCFFDYDNHQFTVVRLQPEKDLSTPGIQHILLNIRHKHCGLLNDKVLELFRFVKNPDLQRAQISEHDMPLLLSLAKRDSHRVALHCGAGLSRSVSKLLMFDIFNNVLTVDKLDKYHSATHFLEDVEVRYRGILQVRPGAVGNLDLLAEAITLAVDLRILDLRLKLNPSKESLLNNSTIGSCRANMQN